MGRGGVGWGGAGWGGLGGAGRGDPECCCPGYDCIPIETDRLKKGKPMQMSRLISNVSPAGRHWILDRMRGGTMHSIGANKVRAGKQKQCKSRYLNPRQASHLTIRQHADRSVSWLCTSQVISVSLSSEEYRWDDSYSRKSRRNASHHSIIAIDYIRNALRRAPSRPRWQNSI